MVVAARTAVQSIFMVDDEVFIMTVVSYYTSKSRDCINLFVLRVFDFNRKQSRKKTQREGEILSANRLECFAFVTHVKQQGSRTVIL